MEGWGEIIKNVNERMCRAKNCMIRTSHNEEFVVERGHSIDVDIHVHVLLHFLIRAEEHAVFGKSL